MLTQIFRKSIVAIFVSLVMISCSDEKKDFKIDVAYSSHVQQFTSGMISRAQEIKVRMVETSEAYTAPGEEVEGEVFTFSPAVEGHAFWVDDQTIEFRPDEYLSSGTEYEVHFNLGKFQKVESKLSDFEFRLMTLKQNFEVNVSGISSHSASDMVWNKLEGEVVFADVIEDDLAEKILSASQSNANLNIQWMHSVDGKQHRFTVDSVERKEEEQKVLVKWDGSSIEVDEEGSIDYSIPSLADFTLMNVEVFSHNNSYALLHFSDPLDPKQNLNGLIRFENNQSLNCQIEGNKVKVHPSSRILGKQTLIVEAGIKNILGYKFKETVKKEISFLSYKPDVKLVGSGTILPSSDGLVFPFRAVNLSAVDVKVIRIFESNVGQFFQVNRYDESSQLRRVGRPVLKKKVPLNSDHVVNQNSWNNYFLDLKELIDVEPGAIYRVSLSFKKAYSLYPCEDSHDANETEEVEENWDEQEEDFSYWDYSEDYYYYNRYNWSQRKDPCSKSYYIHQGSVARNVFATNIGLVAKAGKDRKMMVIATDLRTTDIIAGAEVEIRNYQNQVVASGKTNAQGVFQSKLKMQPYLVVAKRGKERSYLRVDNSTALSTSKFDVSGKVVQKGIKGYLYGERGVWRPGDTLFLSFMIEDKEKTLPKNHPVQLQLFNPSGQLMHSLVSRKGLNGVHTFQVVTDDQAPTGSWRATTKVGGAVFTDYLRIETIKPNRLKVQLNFGEDTLTARYKHLSGKLTAKWLHGAPARNLKTRVNVKLVQTQTKFSKYSEYAFTDPGRSFTAEEMKLYEGRLDNKGNALVTGKLDLNEKAPGMLNAVFTSRVFEEGGDYSTDRYSIPYSPYTRYVGVRLPKGDRRGMLLTDTNHVGELVTVDEKGKLVDVDDLKISVYKISWRWWWEGSSNSIGSYNSNNYRSLVYSTTASTKNGRGQFEFRVNYPDWGRYYVQVEDADGGHRTGKIIYMDWPGWAGRGNRETPGGAHLLMFSSDKAKYKVGETATITIPGSGKGRAFISIENGSKILKTDWVEMDSTEVNYQLPITKEMAPNVYANVTYLQPHKHNNSFPIRLYGVIPLLVEDVETILHPEIKAPKEFQPLTTGRITVSEKDGKAMTYTVAVVDEGLLDLTRFKTPNAHPVFYAREALGVKTWDFYDYVIGAYGGKLEGVLSIGGDGLNKGKKKDKLKRFKPMVRFLGPYHLEAGEKRSHDIDIPNYVGSVRTMVVARENAAYGNAEQATPVRKPLMVLATLPRVVGPKEKLKLPVTVFAMDKKVKTVKVEVKCNNKFKTTTLSKKVTFEDIGDQVVEFDLEVGTIAGDGKVEVKVSGAGEKAHTTVDIPVRHSNVETYDTRSKQLMSGKSDTLKRVGHGMEGTQSYILELSRIPNINQEGRLSYLIRYPHGCAEQTTSKAFPQLYLDKVTDLTVQQKERVNQHVMAAIRKLISYQNPDGGFGYWSGNSSGEYTSNYVGHFMVEAKNKGYSVPAHVIKRWKKFQKSKAQSYSSRSYSNKYGQADYTQVYRLYTLALSGESAMGAMNRLKGSNYLDQVGHYMLAYTYYQAGEQKTANELLKKGKSVGIMGHYSYRFGSDARNDAVMLEVTGAMGKTDEAAGLIKRVAERLGKRGYLNTNAVSSSLAAIGKYMTKHGGQGLIDVEVKIDGKSQNIKTSSALKQINVAIPKTNGAPVLVTNKGTGVVFATLISKGVKAPGEESTYSKNMKLYVQYLDLDNNPIDVTKIAQGTDFKARVTVTNLDSRRLNDIALTEVFPSGWQILNKRMGLEPGSSSSSYMDYEDFRDDRAMCYFSLGRRSSYNKNFSKVFEVQLNASYVGKYYLPGVTVETMYDDEHKAATKGKWVEVVRGN